MAARSRKKTEDPPFRVTAVWNPDKLRATIQRSGRTQEAIARAAGMPLRTLASYLGRGAGSAAPGGARLVSLARILGADPEDWFDVTISTRA